MKLYQLTDKGRALLAKPKHDELTNYDHCCSCCVVLEKENKELKTHLKFIETQDKWWDEDDSNGKDGLDIV